MHGTRTNRRLMVALSLVMVATGFVAVQPVRAQDPAPAASNSRFQVLVPMLERKGAARPDFGKKVAETIAKSIATLPTHIPVPSKDVKEALRKYKLKEEELDCIKNRQLAVQMNAELVMCGSYEPTGAGYTVAAQFISAKTGETFEIAPFAATDPGQAAQQIFQSFGTYVSQIRLAAFCSDYLASQQWPNALENCNQALKINPNSQVALMGKGMALYRLGMAADQSAVTDSTKLVESLETYRKVLELNPIHQDALRQAGIIAARVGQAEASRQYFKQYMELNPGDVGVRLAIAAEAAKNGDPEGALRIAEEGLQGDSSSVDLMTYAGHFAIQAAAAASKANDKTKSTAMYESAAKYYTKVFAARDTATDVNILQNLILANVTLGKTDEAVSIGARAVAARPKDAAVWSAYATALTGAKQTERALAAIDTALTLDPKQPRLAMARARALLSAGRLNDAGEAFRAAVAAGAMEANEASQAVFVEGFEKYRANEWDRAQDYFATARDLASDAKMRGQANFWIGMIYYQRGIAVAKPQTPKAARAALPLFRQAQDYFQGNGVEAYGSATPGVRLGQTLSAVKQYIDIQNQIIKRGQ
jgi:tetratricopeptide (TPR) repeat protein